MSVRRNPSHIGFCCALAVGWGTQLGTNKKRSKGDLNEQSNCQIYSRRSPHDSTGRAVDHTCAIAGDGSGDGSGEGREDGKSAHGQNVNRAEFDCGSSSESVTNKPDRSSQLSADI